MNQTEKTFKKGQWSLQKLGEILTEKKTELGKIGLDATSEQKLSSQINILYQESEKKIYDVAKKFNTSYDNFKAPGKIQTKENQSFKSANDLGFQGEVSLLEKECDEIIRSFSDKTLEVITNATASSSSES